MLIIALPFLVPLVFAVAPQLSPLQYSVLGSSNQTSRTQSAAISRTRFVLVRWCRVVLADTHTLRVMLLLPPAFNDRSFLLISTACRSQLGQPTTIPLGDGAPGDSLPCRRHHENSHIIDGLLSQGGHADEGVTLVVLAAPVISST